MRALPTRSPRHRARIGAVALVMLIGRVAIAQVSGAVAPNTTDTSRPDSPSPRRVRVQFGLSLGFLSPSLSNFGAAGALWGYTNPDVATTLGLDGGAFVGRYALIGMRLGGAWTRAGVATSDGAPLSISFYDVSAIGRFGYPIAGPGGLQHFLGVQIDAGIGAITTMLRRTDSTGLTPRLALQGVYTLHGDRVGVSCRFGWQYAAWPDVAGPGVTLGLLGFTGSLGLEVLL